MGVEQGTVFGSRLLETWDFFDNGHMFKNRTVGAGVKADGRKMTLTVDAP